MSVVETFHQPIHMFDIGDRADGLFTDTLKRLKRYKFVVFSGTALGLYRDNRLIPTDTDIDIIVKGFDGAEQEMKELFKDYPLSLETHKDGVIQQLVFTPNNLILDIHFYYPDGNHYIVSHLSGTFRALRKFFDEPEIRKTQFGKVPFPNDVESFFQQKYGNDWRTPQYRKKGRYEPA